MRRPVLRSATTLYIALGFATAAHASSVTVAPADPEAIYGGSPVEECGWPTTVFMAGCTGSLVHPHVAIFAAHCMFFAGGVGPSYVGFGEASSALTRQVPTQSCTMFPGWIPDESMFGFDVAFCVLAEPVIDVPVVPVLMGCETQILEPGQDITLVGYGVTDTGQVGFKHEVVTQVNGFEGDEINVGGDGTSSCNGDSGGPAYVQLEDGSWRVFGITSRGISSDCNNQSLYGLIHNHTEWIENTSGIDITPCHDADGTWNPSDGCTQFPLNPAIGEAGWELGCAEAALSDPSATCGQPFEPDEETGSTSAGETGLDGSGTGFPGGTGVSTSDGGTTIGESEGAGNESPLDDGGDQVVKCTCRSDAPSPAVSWFLIPLLGAARRRR